MCLTENLGVVGLFLESSLKVFKFMDYLKSENGRILRFETENGVV